MTESPQSESSKPESPEPTAAVAVDADLPPEPFFSRDVFEALVAEMVADEAPRLFAVVQEYGNGVDGAVAAWGMAFENGAELITADGGASMHVASVERATWMFSQAAHTTARIVWVEPRPLTPA